MARSTFSLRTRLLTLAVAAMAPIAFLLVVTAWGLSEFSSQMTTDDPHLRLLLALMPSALTLSLALLASLAIAAFGIHRLVLCKVAALEDAAARIRAGETGVTTGLASDGGEFGRLARTFDSMARALDMRLRSFQDSIEESEERFRKLARIAPVGIYRTDDTGICTYANDSLARILGCSKGRLTGADWRSIIGTAEAPFDGQHEVRLRRVDGRDLWVLINEVIERGPLGAALGRIGVVTDITGQMMAREALRASEQRFRVALKHSRVTVCAYDSDLRYAWMFNGVAGLDRVEGRRATDLYDAAGAARLVAMQRKVLETGIGRRDIVSLDCGGASRVLEVWYEPMVGEGGAICGLVGAGVDITDEIRLHRELVRAREEAERANQAKSRFLAAASHDLRQPFQAMRLFRAALTPHLTDPRAENVAAKLDEAMNAGEQLLNTLLDVSTLEAGIVTPKPAPVSALDLLARLAREFQPQVEARGLRFTVMERPALLLTDAVLLERMLRNLLHNAVRYTERGGILIGARRRGDRLVFQVVDTGLGIPENQQDKIFEDFYQIGNASRDRSRGLGLGLSVVTRMARLLDHPVSLRSQPGRGSVFSISVPLYTERDQAAA